MLIHSVPLSYYYPDGVLLVCCWCAATAAPKEKERSRAPLPFVISYQIIQIAALIGL